EAIRPMGWAVFLDSGSPARSGERYDILAAGPAATLTSPNGPFAAARRLLAGAEADRDATPWPLHGAAIGYFGYEASRAAAGLDIEKPGCRPFMPEVAVGLYPWTIVIDHAEARAALTSLAT